MMAYGHPTPKRQQARSNWSKILELDLGAMSISAMKEKTQFSTTSQCLKILRNTCIIHVKFVILINLLGNQGRTGKSWTGNKNLKSTGYLVKIICACMFRMYFKIWLQLRVYPSGFGTRLINLWMSDERPAVAPLRTLNACMHVFNWWFCFTKLARIKYDANVKLSDRELFRSLPLQDPWTDADMTTVVIYLMDHKHTNVPDSWISTMKEFRDQLMEATTCDPSLMSEYNRLVSTWFWPNLSDM